MFNHMSARGSLWLQPPVRHASKNLEREKTNSRSCDSSASDDSLTALFDITDDLYSNIDNGIHLISKFLAHDNDFPAF